MLFEAVYLPNLSIHLPSLHTYLTYLPTYARTRFSLARAHAFAPQVATTFKHVFNVRPEAKDLYLCTADCGWITGEDFGGVVKTGSCGRSFIPLGVVTYPHSHLHTSIHTRIGHSYVTYGPLLNGASQVVFEGVPSFPDGEILYTILCVPMCGWMHACDSTRASRYVVCVS